MDNKVIDNLVERVQALGLNENQVNEIESLFEPLMAHYQSKANMAYKEGKAEIHAWYEGRVDAMNTCRKIISGIEDDYNFR